MSQKIQDQAENFATGLLMPYRRIVPTGRGIGRGAGSGESCAATC